LLIRFAALILAIIVFGVLAQSHPDSALKRLEIIFKTQNYSINAVFLIEEPRLLEITWFLHLPYQNVFLTQNSHPT